MELEPLCCSLFCVPRGPGRAACHPAPARPGMVALTRRSGQSRASSVPASCRWNAKPEISLSFQVRLRRAALGCRWLRLLLRLAGASCCCCCCGGGCKSRYDSQKYSQEQTSLPPSHAPSFAPPNGRYCRPFVAAQSQRPAAAHLPAAPCGRPEARRQLEPEKLAAISAGARVLGAAGISTALPSFSVGDDECSILASPLMGTVEL